MDGFIFGFLLALAIVAIVPTDSTDKGPFSRSSMVIRTDAATGLQYLESRKGYLTPRIGIDGKQVKEELP